MSPHDARAEKWSHAWLAVCSCGWLGDDRATGQGAVRDARLHNEGKRRPWNPEKFVAWDKRGRPFDAT